MGRINALNILTESEGKEYLAELYGHVIENVQKELVSGSMKNADLSGDPAAGSVEAKRFANAKSKAYGTARAAGKGDAVKAKPVTVAISEDKEIVEELEQKDVSLYGVDGILDRRANNHVLSMASELDSAFFSEAYENAVKVMIDSDAKIEDVLESVIQEAENTHNDYVDGVPRSMMRLVLGTKYYGKIRNNLDKKTRANVDTSEEEFYAWHGVDTRSSIHLPESCELILMVAGAVAQPVMANQYTAEKVPLSEAYGVSLFYHYGTKAVAPDLIFTTEENG